MDEITISTGRLLLRPLEKGDLASTASYAMDVENTKYMCFLPDETVEEVEQFLANVEREWRKETPEFLEFAVLYQGVHIGAVSVYFEKDAGEIGWIIHKDYWGNGFACEAAKALIDYVKAERNVSHFLAHCDTENTASYRVMEKLGMRRTGEWGGRRNRSASEDSFEYRYELY